MPKSSKMESKEIFVHAKQEKFLSDKSHLVDTVMGTRAGGKTGALSYRFYQRPTEMPRGRFFLGAGTLDQLWNNIVPNIFEILEADFSIGLEEGEDYVLGEKPPRWFDKPLQKPKKYENIISWSNGAWTQLITPKLLKPLRGASTDGGDIDEALLWSWKEISGIILPTFRGNRFRFRDCPLHHNLACYSSPPRDAKGMWLVSQEKKALANPKAFSYYYFHWKDNVAVVGEDYGQRMKDTMDETEYDIEVDGKTNITTGEEYYHRFNYKRHVYVVSKGYIGDTKEREYYPDHQINLAFDFGAHINVMWIIQSHGLEERCIDFLFVKKKQKLHVLINKFCNHPRYKNHQNRIINLYGEPRGNDQREDNIPLFEQVQEQFIKNGWECINWVQPYDKADLHKERYVDMNNVFAESDDKPHLPYFRFNAETCEDGIIAIQRTKVAEGFKKDKREEKRPNDYLQEHAPHPTDALDNYRRQKHEGNYTNSGAGSAGVG